MQTAPPPLPDPTARTRTTAPGLPFDLAVLDIAGTTVEEHNAVYVALEEAVRAVGARPSRPDVQRFMGADKTEAITSLLTDRNGEPPTSEEVAAVYADFRRRLREAYDRTPPTPLAGVEQAIAALRGAGVKVVLTTGFSREVADSLLSVLGWQTGVVDAVVCAEEVGAGRPAPYMVFEAMRRTGVQDVRRVVVAGDTVLDLKAGTHAGAGAVVGVLSGAMDAAALGRTPHTHLLASVAEIPALFLP
jgi:phosphonatase-like hydrolase